MMEVNVFKSLKVGENIESTHSGKRIEIIEKQSSDRYIACNGVAHFPVSIYDRNMYRVVIDRDSAICTHKPAPIPTTQWVLTSPDGRVVDCAEMSESRAMGHNQMRANANTRNRWESFNPAIHGAWSRVVAMVEALTDDEGAIDLTLACSLASIIPIAYFVRAIRNAFGK